MQLPIARVRFVAVSATIPNVADIATWLDVPPAGLQVFGEDHRPCKLTTVVRGYTMPKASLLNLFTRAQQNCHRDMVSNSILIVPLISAFYFVLI